MSPLIPKNKDHFITSIGQQSKLFINKHFKENRTDFKFDLSKTKKFEMEKSGIEEYIKSLSLPELKNLDSLVKKELDQHSETVDLRKVWKIIKANHRHDFTYFDPEWNDIKKDYDLLSIRARNIHKKYYERIMEFENFKAQVQKTFPPEFVNSTNNQEFAEIIWDSVRATIYKEIQEEKEKDKNSLPRSRNVKVFYNEETEEHVYEYEYV